MKSYFIFAIILTAIYVVYYAANIARDLYRKRSQGRTDEEVFELDPDNGQDSVAVTESETGFNVGTEKYETAFDNSGTSIQDGAADTDKESAEERFARMKAEAEAKMEDSTPYLSEAFTADDMYKAHIVFFVFIAKFCPSVSTPLRDGSPDGRRKPSPCTYRPL